MVLKMTAYAAVILIILACNFHNSEYYPSSSLSLKTQSFGDWILFPSSHGTYSAWPNR
jgi:hypothetical protein